ncbi:MAG: ATP-binding cassette domain-containing protein [Bacteroidia bacterium]|nr:ATP-binding cassette domain-containing protein [Bacteroidia bacterium]MCZ2276869.1 ATP-binding cassette domain-containing protein [Bacteroidia bacterium]
MTESKNETVIQLDHVEVFNKNNLILSDVSLNVSKGEFVYLIGKTGSGKSSLLKMLYGELKLNQGSGFIAGFQLSGLKSGQIPQLRRKLGIVFQDFQLLTDRSVGENLEFVLKATGWKDLLERSDRINEVLGLVGLSTKGFKMPHELSGGEQQRVVIARALLNKPDIILADEPSGNLDPETTDEIMNLLHDITKTGTATIMATHNYSLIEKFPGRVIVCESGKVFSKN